MKRASVRISEEALKDRLQIPEECHIDKIEKEVATATYLFYLRGGNLPEVLEGNCVEIIDIDELQDKGLCDG